MQFRKFNHVGVETFREYLQKLRSDPTLSPPSDLLSSTTLSEPLSPAISATVQPFINRMAFASWLFNAAITANVVIPRLDPGFWSWLSLALFDQVCPPDGHGRRKPGADARHIPDTRNWQRRYRHLLANPFEVYLLHRDNPTRALVALINPLDKPGELTEQITGRVEVVRCPGTMALASYLYIDPTTAARRKGASGDAARRLGKLMNQYTRTWDLPLMESPTFARMLPRSEFKQFADAAESATVGAAL